MKFSDMKNYSKTSRVTIAFVTLAMITLVLAGLFLTLKVVHAIQPFESLLPSKEGVTQWRYYTHTDLLGYSFDVDHVYRLDSLSGKGNYTKTVSVRLPARYRVNMNNDETQKILISKSNPKDVFASADNRDSSLVLRISDPTIQQQVLWGCIVLIAAVITIVFFWLWQFRKLLISIGNSDSQFTIDNVKRLNKLGFILVGVVVLQILFNGIVNAIILTNFTIHLNGVRIDPVFQPNIIMLAFGLTLIVLAGVIRHGVQLKEEQALTI
jgi:hypothetical protein